MAFDDVEALRNEVEALRAKLGARDLLLRRAMEEKGRALLAELALAHEAAAKDSENARCDPLTGLLRHGIFRMRLAFECERSARTEDPLGFLLVDLDRFARLNEEHGYDEGERALAMIGRGVQSLWLARPARRPPILGREAGTRFGAILPGADARMLHARAEDIRSFIERLPLTHRLTASVGVASWSAGHDAKTLLEEASNTLDVAKSRGGNCIGSSVPGSVAPERLEPGDG